MSIRIEKSEDCSYKDNIIQIIVLCTVRCLLLPTGRTTPTKALTEEHGSEYYPEFYVRVNRPHEEMTVRSITIRKNQDNISQWERLSPGSRYSEAITTQWLS